MGNGNPSSFSPTSGDRAARWPSPAVFIQSKSNHPPPILEPSSSWIILTLQFAPSRQQSWVRRTGWTRSASPRKHRTPDGPGAAADPLGASELDEEELEVLEAASASGATATQRRGGSRRAREQEPRRVAALAQ
ncbi:hypothetical protein SETIT_3G030800v2 [Setaria italica]|uniref:Uncharacterized protein n=1 Tax=Setaria italica TaxID=4555 RepID=A0A368QB44_SETIT|nr:hypothetical protein SETIT_3G030800v2 [Setaria italica]